MFVLGFRAKRLRQGKLADLIHVSEGKMDIDSCSVAIHFCQIRDLSDHDFERLPGTELIVSRTAHRNNKTIYSLNGQACTVNEVTERLKGLGMDLDHNRFLILQGEVEQIAQMKAKGTTEHEEGLLEYLEDIVGSNRLIPQIEQSGRDLEAMGLQLAERQVRLGVAEGEYTALQAERQEALSFLRLENQLSERRCELAQATMARATEAGTKAAQTLEQNRQKLLDLQTKHQADAKLANSLEVKLKEKQASLAKLQATVARDETGLKKLTEEDVSLQERRRHLKSKLKAASKVASDSQRVRSDLERTIFSAQAEIKSATLELEGLRKNLVAQEAELDRLCEGIQAQTRPFQAQLEAKQALLAPHQEKQREIQASIDLLQSEVQILEAKANRGDVEAVGLRARAQEIQREVIEVTAQEKEARAESATLSKALQSMRSDLASLQETLSAGEREVTQLQSMLNEARAALASSSESASPIAAALLKESKAGRIPGVHGRLGDLGTIDERFDVAVSTACGMLNHIVVDTMEGGQKCIEYLRKNNLGRASFIMLDKMRPEAPSAGNLPAGVHRLFDLIQAAKPIFAPAFAFACGQTLVAETVAQASALTGRRVVTLEGRLFEGSGTISGGGRVIRGSMKTGSGKRTQAAEEVSPEQVKQLEQLLGEKNAALRGVRVKIGEVQELLTRRTAELSALETKSQKLTALLRSLPQELAQVEAELAGLGQKHLLSKAEQDKLNKLRKELQAQENKLSTTVSEMAPLIAECEVIKGKLMDAGGVKVRAQRSKVEGIREQIATLTDLVNRHAAEEREAQAKLSGLAGVESGDLEGELASLEEQMQQLTQKALEATAKLEASKRDYEIASDELSELQSQMDELQKTAGHFKRQEYDLRVAIEADEEVVLEAEKQVSRAQEELAGLSLHAIPEDEDDGAIRAPALAFYEGNDLVELVRRHEQILQAVKQLQGQLELSRPNLGVLEEYRAKRAVYRQFAAEMESLEAQRRELRGKYDGLRQQRYDEFMAGLRVICGHLRETYHLITMGGTAELELVDSLDPFTEGILLSVMPPRKSWRPIANLSGGERTLASLALLLALHRYKPTPIYVMDEIDAALDFRNVSIVASLLKTGAKDAQFIVISLRNGMFEQADRLVGVWKIGQCTRSVAIDPHQFSISSQ